MINTILYIIILFAIITNILFIKIIGFGIVFYHIANNLWKLSRGIRFKIKSKLKQQQNG